VNAKHLGGSVMLVIMLLCQPFSGAAGGNDLGGCSLFPPNNVWDTPVDGLPVDPSSVAYIESIGADTGLHADFGGPYLGRPNGIPYNLVPWDQPLVPIFFRYAQESDHGPYPFPPDVAIEGGGTTQPWRSACAGPRPGQVPPVRNLGELSPPRGCLGG
jgi:hypothetical protein